jgi:hypothetical protein
MAIKFSEIMNDSRFQYLFGDFEVELDETSLALLGRPSSKTYDQALEDWHLQKPPEIKLIYKNSRHG